MHAARSYYLAATSSLTPGSFCSGLLCSVSPRFAGRCPRSQRSLLSICKVIANSDSCIALGIRLSFTKFSPWHGFSVQAAYQVVAIDTAGQFYTRCARFRVLVQTNINIVCVAFFMAAFAAAATVAGAVIGSNHHHLLISEQSCWMRARSGAVCGAVACFGYLAVVSMLVSLACTRALVRASSLSDMPECVYSFVSCWRMCLCECAKQSVAVDADFDLRSYNFFQTKIPNLCQG